QSLVEAQRLAVLLEGGPWKQVGATGDLVLDPLDQERDLLAPRPEGFSRRVDVERGRVGKTDAPVRPILEAAHRQPGGAVDLQPLVDRAYVALPFGLTVRRLERANHLPVDDDLDPLQRETTLGAALEVVFADTRGGFEGVSRVLAVQLHQEHRPGGDETPPLVQAPYPGLVA